jgi:hypothetical protein
MNRAQVGMIALVVCATPAAARAQGLGLKGGLSYGNVSNSGVLPGDDKQRTGFAFGLALESASPVGLGIEGLYAQRGVTSSTPGDSRELDYIDVPLYLRLALPIPGSAPFVYAGPQVSFQQKCTDGSGTCPDSGHSTTTYAAVIGAGLHIGGLSVEGRYIYGLTNLNLNTVTTKTNYQTRSFEILLGIGM